MKNIFLLLVLTTCILISCSKDNNMVIEVDKDVKETLERERALWDEQKNKNYQFAYHHDDDVFMSIPYGTLVAKIAITDGEEPLFVELSPNFPDNYIRVKSVSDAYDMVNHLIDKAFLLIEIIKAKQAGKKVTDTYSRFVISVRLNIIYNAQYHYPEEIIYRTEHSEPFSDGGRGTKFRITEFTPIINEN